MVGEAIYDYTANDTMRIKSLAWSSTGWDTGVGIVAITTDDLSLVEEFRDVVAQVEYEGQRFITMPKQMLLKKYALTIYFGRQFHRFETPKLMEWLGICNDLRGEFELVETRNFPKDHDNPRRRGARIVAFEGNQEFLDSLHSFPKDYPFNIRFGGNLYIRGGDRYLKRKYYNLIRIPTNQPTYLSLIHI